MAKTACEQEAEYLELRGHPHSARADALRAEGRELKRLRDAVFNWKFGTFNEVGEACKTMDREAARIQKAREAK